MGGFAIIPILGEHVEDQLRPSGSPPPEPSVENAFDHELDDRPKPYFPADEADSGKEQS